MAASVAPGNAGDQKADEGHGDDDWSRGDHGDGHGIEELLFAQPPELLHHALIEEGHDGQAAAKDERAGLGEEEQDLPEDVGLRGGNRQRRVKGRTEQRRASTEHGQASAQPRRRRLDQQHQESRQEEELRQFRLRHRRDDEQHRRRSPTAADPGR